MMNNKCWELAKGERWYAKNYELQEIAYLVFAVAYSNSQVINPHICESCLTEDVVISGHHEDYAKPLDVIWLCASCHLKIHTKSQRQSIIDSIKKKQPIETPTQRRLPGFELEEDLYETLILFAVPPLDEPPDWVLREEYEEYE